MYLFARERSGVFGSGVFEKHHSSRVFDGFLGRIELGFEGRVIADAVLLGAVGGHPHLFLVLDFDARKKANRKKKGVP